MQQDGAMLLHIRPVAPALAFLAMAVLLGTMFGLPAIGVALDPARRDPWSLAAMGFGLLVAAAAAGIVWTALAGRRARRLRLDAEGIHRGAELWRWQEIRAVALRLPARGAAATDAVQRLGAAIADHHLAGSAQVILRCGEGSPEVLLAGGLDRPTAEAVLAEIRGFGLAHGLDPAAVEGS
jgi:hypothetical protein